MKTSARFVALALIACSSHPDSVSFTDPPQPSAAGSGAVAGSSASAGGAGNSDGEGAGAPAEPQGGSLVAPGGDAGAAAGATDAGAGVGGEPTIEPAVCGNGKLEPGEQCDDGGAEGKDGCDANCRVRCEDFGAKASADFHCYAGYDEADFEGARAACAARGAHLVTIESESENELVRGLVRSSKWIGAFEDVPISSDQAGVHRWVTGAEVSYQKWGSGQPDRASSRCSRGGLLGNASRCYEHCVFMQSDGTWADARCDEVDGYVCEWEPQGS